MSKKFNPGHQFLDFYFDESSSAALPELCHVAKAHAFDLSKLLGNDFPRERRKRDHPIVHFRVLLPLLNHFEEVQSD